MLKYLLERPTAVCTVFITILIIGIISYFQIPTTLMPTVDAPYLRIQVSYPRGNPRYIEKSILQPIRNSISSVYGLKGIESISATGVGQVDVALDYEADPKLAYLEVNEKLDQIINTLPEDLPRPVVQQVNPTDIPIVRIQMTSTGHQPLKDTDLAKFVVSRRLEQIKGVSLVEINGSVEKIMRIMPDEQKMQALGITIQDITTTLREANISQRQIHVKDGIYAYNIVFNNWLTRLDGLKSLRVKKGDLNIALGKVAHIETTHSRRQGKHLLNGAEGIVLAVHMQSSARMDEVLKQITLTLQDLRQQYPEIQFSTTQNQGSLLSNTIYQLFNSLALGALVAFLILFIFSAEFRSPWLIGILIPASIALTLILMFVSGLTLNLITVSGLILGLGILVDNGIIIIDNISAKVTRLGMDNACIVGVSEVATPMTSSLLTTLCVFLPLLFLGGLAETLFLEQILTLAMVLTASLVVAFTLLPVLFRLIKPQVGKGKDRIFDGVKKIYLKSKPLTHRIIAGLILVTALGITAVFDIQQKNLPDIQTNDTEVLIYWSKPLSLEKNQEYTRQLVEELHPITYEADLGMTQLRESTLNVVHQTRLYLKFTHPQRKHQAIKSLQNKIRQLDSTAVVRVSRAKNPYDQLFAQSGEFAQIKLKTSNASFISLQDLKGWKGYNPGYGFQKQDALKLIPKKDLLASYNISIDELIDRLSRHLDDQRITLVDKLNETVPVTISGPQSLSKVKALKFQLDDTTSYPLTHFLDIQPTKERQFFTADQSGLYQSIRFQTEPDNWSQIEEDVKETAYKKGWLYKLDGWVTEREENYQTLLLAIFLSILLLYIILVAQFESLLAPLVILSEIPIAMAGSVLLLWLTFNSLNISSLMGMIISLGIIVNDSILKLDAIIRYRKAGMEKKESISQAGKDRLKPILMTTLTTIIALIPVLFTTGFGGGLQQPMVIALIGGLFIGTLCSIYLMPKAYDYLIK